jgi:hypothetical protein
MRRPDKKESYYSDGYKEAYMNKEIDKKELEDVNGGFGEHLPDIQEMIRQQKEEIKNATTHPDAKKQQGDYKKTR